MSKAVAYTDKDGFLNPTGETVSPNTDLYATDHAEELAKALDKVLNEAIDDFYSETDPDHYLEGAHKALNNYRESTK